MKKDSSSSNVKAVMKHVRISPKKARLAAQMIRGLHVGEALCQLKYCEMKAGRLLAKCVKSALKNAEYNNGMQATAIYVDEVRIDEGFRLKRSWARSRGGRSPIMKRTSHFTVVVKEFENIE